MQIEYSQAAPPQPRAALPVARPHLDARPECKAATGLVIVLIESDDNRLRRSASRRRAACLALVCASKAVSLRHATSTVGAPVKTDPNEWECEFALATCERSLSLQQQRQQTLLIIDVIRDYWRPQP